MANAAIFISDLLPDRAPNLARTLRRHLDASLAVVPGTKDIWCRDYMPAVLPGGRFVQFRYNPDYLRDSPELRTEDGAGLLRLRECVLSDIVLDGGNLVRHGRTAIVTDKIYRENGQWKPARLRAAMIELLELERLIVVPAEPDDPFGHADGMLAFAHERTLLINDYRRANAAFGRELSSLLKRRGFDLLPFPYCPSARVIDGVPSAYGVYVNVLQTRDAVFVPTFGRPEDEHAAAILQRVMSGRDVIPVRCDELADEGGLLHCATWNASEEP